MSPPPVRSWASGSSTAVELLVRLALVVFVGEIARDVFTNDVSTYFFRAQDVGWHHLPYKDFLWEYPPLASLPLALIPLLGRSNAAFHVAFVLGTVAMEYGSLCLLRRALVDAAERARLTRFWNAAVLPLAAIAWFRLDFAPMLCATLAVLAMTAGRRWVAPTVLGFAVKLWPIVFVVPMVLRRRYRDAGLAVAASAAVVAGWWAFSPTGFGQFLDFRAGSGFQVESLPGAITMLFSDREVEYRFGAMVVGDQGVHWVQAIMGVVLVGAPALCSLVAWRRRSRGLAVDDVALMGAFVGTALVCQRLLSPQFLVWLAPFLALRLARRERIAAAFVVSSWITAAVIQWYWQFLSRTTVLVGAVVVRDLLLVGITVALYVAALRPAPEDVNP